MSAQHNTLVTAALVDAMGRFIGNVGVPATIALFILYQITPRLDRIADQNATSVAQLSIMLASCSRPADLVAPRGDREP